MISASHLWLLSSLLGHSFTSAIPNRLKAREVTAANLDAAAASNSATDQNDPNWPFADIFPLQAQVAAPEENDEFPPNSYLGFSFDMTSLTPLDIDTVSKSLLTFARLIKLDPKSEPTSLPSGGQWKKPLNVHVKKNVTSGEANFEHWSDGQKAFDAFSGKVAAKANYKMVNGDASVSAGTRKSFQDNYAYAQFDYSENQVEVDVEDWSKYIDEELLKRLIHRIPPFDAKNTKTTSAYRNLFKLLGTHIVTDVSYGSRLSLSVWTSNSNDETVKNLEADINFAFKGLMSGGSAGASVNGTDQYKYFSSSYQRSIGCDGGDPKLAAKIRADVQADDVYKTFEAWTASAEAGSKVTGFTTVALWVVLSGALDDELAARAGDLQLAYNHILQNPQKHVTECTLIVGSDWGSLNLLVPSAYINLSNDNIANLPGGTYYSSTKIGWENPEGLGHLVSETIIAFQIINDGSPINIDLNHGDVGEGDVPSGGRISVQIGTETCANPAAGDASSADGINRKVCNDLTVDPNALEAITPKPGSDAPGANIVPVQPAKSAVLPLSQQKPGLSVLGAGGSGSAAAPAAGGQQGLNQPGAGGGDRITA